MKSLVFLVINSKLFTNAVAAIIASGSFILRYSRRSWIVTSTILSSILNTFANAINFTVLSFILGYPRTSILLITDKLNSSSIIFEMNFKPLGGNSWDKK